MWVLANQSLEGAGRIGLIILSALVDAESVTFLDEQIAARSAATSGTAAHGTRIVVE